MHDRMKLPVNESYNEILDAMENNSVIIIRGETGSGKTTQVIIDWLIHLENFYCYSFTNLWYYFRAMYNLHQQHHFLQNF